MTSIHFAGSWSPLAAFSLSAALATASALLYDREIQDHPSRLSRLLPLLRAAAVFLMSLMLAGPALHQRLSIGKPTRLRCWIDSSLSMSVCDPEMHPARKILLVEQLGWIRPGSARIPSAEAAQKLRQSHAFLSAFKTDAPDSAAAQDAAQKVGEAIALLRKQPLPVGLGDKLERNLLLAWNEFVRHTQSNSHDPHRLRTAHRQLEQISLEGLAEAERLLSQDCKTLIAKDPTLRTALERLDRTPRSERLSALLLGGKSESFLAQLAAHFDVELWTSNDKEGRLIWSNSNPTNGAPERVPDPTLRFTDLSPALNLPPPSASTPESGPRSALLIFTDGQQNDGTLPLSAASLLGDRQVPIFPVGFGQTERPLDLAITRVEAPKDVFHEDRVSGRVHLAENLPQGQSFTLQIALKDRIVWEQQLTATGQSARSIPFDFPIRDLAPLREASKASAPRRASIPLEFTATAVPVDGERETRNNSARFDLRTTQRRRKMLLLDGRPRWEIRYLRNLFDRDPQWEVTCLLGGVQPTLHWPRGENLGTFPVTEQALHAYDLIVFGEVPPDALSEQELRWIHSFVSERGGGLLLLDGRGLLQSYLHTPIGPLFPVRHSPSATLPLAEKILPAPAAEALPPLRLSGTGPGMDPVWNTLAPPRSLVSCEALPGTETLLEAHAAKRRAPALVSRQFGAGRVVYAAFDETWRWRLDVAGLYQERFWNQLIPWISEPPFAIEDGNVSLDAGCSLYAPGETAELRTRVRNAKGLPLIADRIQGTLTRDGITQGKLVLPADARLPGIFRGKTQPLEAGRWEFSVDSQTADAPNRPVTVSWEVQPRQTAELSELNLREAWLTQIAEASKGAFFTEEQLPQLLEKLQPWVQGEIIEKETALWQTYPWLLLVVSLLTAEWILRKRLGLI